jgi:hypothetical protein
MGPKIGAARLTAETRVAGIEIPADGRSTAVVASKNFFAAARSPSSRTGIAIFALAVALLFAINMLHAYQLGFQSRMYDNPLYRWRESLVIALSRMQPQPSHGYVGYGSILAYFAQHGLALMDGEVQVPPSSAEISALVKDGARMDQLMQAASRVAIDPKLPPVILQGNELGLIDYTYWAFKLYGISINALVLFYFTLLFVSVTLFFVTFRHSRFCLLLLMLYLAGHLFALNYAQSPIIQVIQNSRFFPVLALVPSLHLLLLVATRARPTPALVAMACAQVFILMFVLFCRTQTFWEVLAILLATTLLTDFGPLKHALRHPGRWLVALGRVGREAWPAVLTVFGMIVLIGYSHFAPDERLYTAESKAHIFWHDLFVGTIESDPELHAAYSYGVESDNIGYAAALHDLRGRNDSTSSVARESNGVIEIDVMKSNGIYDQQMRRLYFRIVREHPWWIVRSFLIGKPASEVQALLGREELRNPRSYVYPILLALGATILALALGVPGPSRKTAARGAALCAAVLACSTLVTFFFPTALIPEVLVTWLLVLMVCVLYLPLALLLSPRRLGQPAD